MSSYWEWFFYAQLYITCIQNHIIYLYHYINLISNIISDVNILDNFSSALQLAMSYLKPRLATWKSSHPCWVPSRYAWHGPRRRQQRCNNCCNNEGRWLEDGRIFCPEDLVKAKKWPVFVGEVDPNTKERIYIYFNLRWSRCGVRCGWKQVDERSTKKIHDWFRDLACESITTWLLDAIDIDWSHCIGNIGYIGCWFEWSSALLCWDWFRITRLDALCFTFLLSSFWSTKMHLNHVWSVYSLEGNLDGDPVEIWFRAAEWPLGGV